MWAIFLFIASIILLFCYSNILQLEEENIELNKLKSTLLLRIDKLIEENKEKTQAEVAEISNSDVLVESAEK